MACFTYQTLLFTFPDLPGEKKGGGEGKGGTGGNPGTGKGGRGKKRGGKQDFVELGKHFNIGEAPLLCQLVTGLYGRMLKEKYVHTLHIKH